LATRERRSLRLRQRRATHETKKIKGMNTGTRMPGRTSFAHSGGSSPKRDFHQIENTSQAQRCAGSGDDRVGDAGTAMVLAGWRCVVLLVGDLSDPAPRSRSLVNPAFDIRIALWLR
jgi:hypothetical protein